MSAYFNWSIWLVIRCVWFDGKVFLQINLLSVDLADIYTTNACQDKYTLGSFTARKLKSKLKSPDVLGQLLLLSCFHLTGSFQEDQRTWCHRPATQKMLRAIAKNVMHLIRLRQELLQMMLANFIKGVDIYLSCIRDRDDSELGSNQMVRIAAEGFVVF